MKDEMKPMSADELRTFIGLCILAGIYHNNHEAPFNLWSEREGRPVFIATMARTRYRNIMNYWPQGYHMK
jgi:hypothetical protein